MRIIDQVKDFSSIKDKVVLVIGNFDGLHRGHVRIIRYAVKEARKKHAKCFALTFLNHPACVLKGVEPLLLQTNAEKVKMMEELGVDGMLLLKFTEAFARQTPRQFLERLTSRIRIIKICVGENFFFGKGNSGNTDILRKQGKELGFALKAFSLLHDDKLKVTISSTNIRHFLLAGETVKAGKLLGYPYSLESIVVQGERLGQTIGFPTINFNIASMTKTIPKDGVYEVTVQIGKAKKKGLTYIGPKSVANKTSRVFETWIQGWAGDLYGKSVTVSFGSYIRPPIRFKNKEELMEQLSKDRMKMNKMPRRQS